MRNLVLILTMLAASCTSHDDTDFRIRCIQKRCEVLEEYAERQDGKLWRYERREGRIRLGPVLYPGTAYVCTWMEAR